MTDLQRRLHDLFDGTGFEIHNTQFNNETDFTVSYPSNAHVNVVEAHDGRYELSEAIHDTVDSADAVVEVFEAELAEW